MLVLVMVDGRDAVAGMSKSPLSSVLLSGCRPASKDALFWLGLCCSSEAQDGGEAEEEGQDRSRGEAGVAAGSSFSIMVMSCQYQAAVPQLPSMCVRVTVSVYSSCMCEAS